jgi:hypothetical protein
MHCEDWNGILMMNGCNVEAFHSDGNTQRVMMVRVLHATGDLPLS